MSFDFIKIINLMSEHYNQTITTSWFQNYVLLLNFKSQNVSKFKYNVISMNLVKCKSMSQCFFFVKSIYAHGNGAFSLKSFCPCRFHSFGEIHSSCAEPRQDRMAAPLQVVSSEDIPLGFIWTSIKSCLKMGGTCVEKNIIDIKIIKNMFHAKKQRLRKGYIQSICGQFFDAPSLDYYYYVGFNSRVFIPRTPLP